MRWYLEKAFSSDRWGNQGIVAGENGLVLAWNGEEGPWEPRLERPVRPGEEYLAGSADGELGVKECQLAVTSLWSFSNFSLLLVT